MSKVSKQSSRVPLGTVRINNTDYPVNITREWYRYLDDVFTRIGGADSVTPDGLIGLALKNSELGKDHQPGTVVTAGAYAISTRTADGYQVSVNLPSVALAVSALIPQQRPYIPSANDALPQLARQFFG